VTSNHHVVARNEGSGEREQLLAGEGPSSLSARTGARPPVGSWLGLVAGIAAALAPKCPICLAAYLSMLGIGVGLARFAPMLFPFGVVLASIAFISLVRSRRRPPQRESRCTK
jgi:hypothetical protein